MCIQPAKLLTLQNLARQLAQLAQQWESRQHEAVVRNQRKSTVGTVIQKAIMKLGFLRRQERSIVRLMLSSVRNAGKKHHFTDACKTGNWKQKKDDKKAKVNVVNTVDNVAPDTSAVSVVSTPTVGPPGPVAALNSVQQVARRAEYTFDPERYSEASNSNVSFWAVSSSIPIQTQRLWGQDGMEVGSVESASVARQAIGHYIFDNESEIWRRRAPPAHAAKKVQIELDRASYISQARTKEMRSYILAWAFPDTVAQVTLINPAMVAAMGVQIWLPLHLYS